LYLITTYSGKEWIFMKYAQFIVDGKDYNYSFISPNRDVRSNAYVVESDALSVDENIYNLLNAIKNSKTEIDVRLLGDKSFDFVLSKSDKEYLIFMLDLVEKYKIK